jgi:hypothetical protein
MALTPYQLNQLHDDVDRIYFRYFIPIYGGDSGGWVASDSGILAPASVEAARLKVFADAHLTAHRQDGRARDIFIRLAAMGKTSSATVDTGTS